MSGDDDDGMDDDDDTLCPCVISKGKVAHNPSGCAGASGIGTPLQIDNGSGSVLQTGGRGLLEDLAGPRDRSPSAWTDGGEMAAALPMLSRRAVKKIRVFGLRPKLTSTFPNGIALAVLNKRAGSNQIFFFANNSLFFVVLSSGSKKGSQPLPLPPSPPPKPTMLSLNPGCICDVCAEEYGPRNLPHSITCGQWTNAEPAPSLPV